MATVKVVLDKRTKKKDNTYPIKIRIYSGSQYRDVGIGKSVMEDEFDIQSGRVKKTHPNHKLINQLITQKQATLEQTSVKLEINEGEATANSIIASLSKRKTKVEFIEYGWKCVSELHQLNKVGNAHIYRDALNALSSYSGRKSIPFRDMTYTFLKNIEIAMLSAEVKPNSISLYFRTIRAIYNRAIKEKLVDRANYPFESFKIKTEATAKRNISKAELEAVMALELKIDSPIWHARNYFILSFNIIGISFADMVTLKQSEIINGRVMFRRKKTHKLYNIKLTKRAEAIISLYDSNNRTYILPVIPEMAVGNLVEERKYIQYGTRITNNYLKKIGTALKIQQELTTYVARHSWATIAKKMGYSKDLIAEALGHEFGNKVTGIYLDSFDQEVIDNMNDNVCNLGLDEDIERLF